MRDPKTDELVNDGSDYPIPAAAGAKIDKESRLEATSLLGEIGPRPATARIHADSKPNEGSLLAAKPNLAQPAAIKIEPDSRAPKSVRAGRKKTSRAKRKSASLRKVAGTASKATAARKTGGASGVPDPAGVRRAPSTALHPGQLGPGPVGKGTPRP